MPRRWRPPPSWPPPPHPRWSPPAGWRPDPSWPPPPPGWQFWQHEPSKAWLAVPAAVVGVIAVGVIGSLADDGAPVTTSPVLAEESRAPTSDPAATAATTTAATTAATTVPPATRTTSAAPQRTAATRTTAKAPAPRRTTARPRPTEAPSGDCDPNYSGACVPVASDVDCGSGSGNGPEYLYGTARVVGDDVYGLDSDDDGIACEKG